MQPQFIKPAIETLYWGIEYLFALGLIIVGPLWVITTITSLTREPSVGEVLWLIFWLVVSVALVWAGRYRWQVLNARRAH
jgi:hypothetical protein